MPDQLYCTVVIRNAAPLVFCLSLLAAVCAAAQERPPLTGDADYNNGLAALADELPGVAATRLETALAKRRNDDPARATIQLRLLEAYVRSGNIEKALPLLDLPALADDPTTLFWNACAHVILGHYFEASETFALLSEAADPTLRYTANLNRARLLAGLGEREEALALLQGMNGIADPDARDEATLLRASILLDTGTPDEAADLLAPLAPKSPSHRKQQSYLLARLALSRGKHEEASERFLALVEAPEHLPQTLHFGSILGHADSLAALGREDDAVAFLLSRIEKNTRSKQFEQFFDRLVRWSAESETRSELLQTRLVAWSEPGANQGNPLLRGFEDPVAIALAGNWNADAQTSDLSIYALFHHALFLARKNDPEAVIRAQRLLNRLRLEAPTHPLALDSLLESALLHLGDKHKGDALACLEALESLADPGNLKAEAAELAARIRYSEGDYPEAAAAFSRARVHLTNDSKRFTAINQGLAQLMSGADAGFGQLLESLDDEEAAESLQLERAILLASKRDASAKELLGAFLRSHPDHIRSAEARLALAELSLFTDSRDLSMALSQLDSIDPAGLSDRSALRYLLARLKLGELTGTWDDGIAAATNYLRTRDTPEKPAVLLKLGEAFFINGNYNEARIQFGQVLKIEEAGRHHEVARFYAAKAGLRVGTEEARQSALELLHRVGSDNGPLAVEARLQLARTHLDASQPEAALKELSPVLTEDTDRASRIDALLLAAEAHLAIGKSSHIDECLAIYDELLAREDLSYALSNRVHFLKGLALEKLGDPARAMDTYYRVINGENRPKDAPITEWKFFYDCGFRALSLLEEDKRWRPALQVARILADTNANRAEEAHERAEDIQLKHMIWEKE